MNKTAASDEIGIFVRVVERGGFAAAAEETGLTPSGVSKAVTRLEDRLGVKLLQRTTRRLMMTAEGETLLERGREILAAIEATEAEVMAARGKPKGTIRVNMGTAYAKHRLAPVLPKFRALYPEIDLIVSVADRRVDVIGIDCACLHDLLHFGDGHFPGGGHVGIEIARGLAENEIAGCIGFPGLHDRKVRPQPGLAQIQFALEFLHRLAFGHNCAHAGPGIERRNTRPSSPDAFGQCALRVKFQFQLPGQV